MAKEVQAAWLKFKDDIESAMEKKPKQGFYKNLSDMMHSKMEMLDQVGHFDIFPVDLSTFQSQ